MSESHRDATTNETSKLATASDVAPGAPTDVTPDLTPDATAGASSAASISDPTKPSHFIRTIIERDLEAGTYAQRRFAGTPGDAHHHEKGPLDPARIRTRFPPEPNGYLHIGHAKSITLNFGLAQDFGGACHLRFDDTNPAAEDQEYVDSIIDSVRWLGYDWTNQRAHHLYFASNYFDAMFDAAQRLIETGHAYVDEQTQDEIRENRGDFNTPGKPSRYRDRPRDESLKRLIEMSTGQHAEGSMVLRAKIDMASPNINLRDPVIYRIKHASHHNTGDSWHVYPMYAYAHPIEDALENITHSICTLEFEDQRPFYDWVLERLSEEVTLDDGRVLKPMLRHPLPRQYEFARLNLTHVITSKRKLRQLVEEGIVDGWDDPRMPTLVGMRRRGYTPESIRLMCERAGTSKAGGWTEYASLDAALREDLEGKAPRAMVVLDPLPLKIVNWREVFGSDVHRELCSAPMHPARPDMGVRQFGLAKDIWIEADDFAEVPPKGFHRLYPGNRVRLKYGYVVECTGCEKDAGGQVTAVLARLLPDTRSGTPGAESVKVKGTITWVAAFDAVPATVNLYEHLFTEPQPDQGGRDFMASLNPANKRIMMAMVEPSLGGATAESRWQFERHGYFVADHVLHKPGHMVFNRITSLKDSFQGGDAKGGAKGKGSAAATPATPTT
jgi:glutaminyl-tRNA synthetase